MKHLTIEQLINDYGSYIYNYAFKLSANEQDANDITQNTFIKAWKNLDTLKNPDAIKKWLRTICLNELRMKLKKDQKIKIDYTENLEKLEKDSFYFLIPEPSLLDETFVSEEVTKLRDGCFLAMARKLTIHQRIAFSLVDMFGLSIDETANILDTTPKAVKGLLYRARMNLEAFFHEHCSILDASNPCLCTSWIEFVKNRQTMQKELKDKLDVLDYQKTDYIYNEKIRRKILNIYSHIPEQKPSDQWFSSMIILIENYFEKNI